MTQRGRRPAFDSQSDYWTFASSVKLDARFVHAREVTRILRTIVATAKNRVALLPEGTILFRAQVGGHKEPAFRLDRDGRVTGPFHEDRMKPINRQAKEGRANPAGMAYLYCASNPETALAEVRPWIGAWVSIGKFRLRRTVKLVDCTVGRQKWKIHPKEPSPAERAKCVWRDINDAFSRPVSLEDSAIDYVPTQVLGDLFKRRGYDGVVYRSSCSRGRNLILFNSFSAEMERSNLCRVEGLKYRYVVTGAVYTPPADTKGSV